MFSTILETNMSKMLIHYTLFVVLHVCDLNYGKFPVTGNAWSKAAQIRGVGVDTRPAIESISRFVHFCTTCIYTELSTFCAGGHTHVRLLSWLFFGGHTSSTHKPPMHNGCHHFTHPPTHYDTTNPHKLLGNARPLPYEVSPTPCKSNSFLG